MIYKGYSIELSEKTGVFTVYVESEKYFSSTNLIEVKAAIDKLAKKTFKRDDE